MADDASEFRHAPLDGVRVDGSESVADLADRLGGAGMGARDLHDAVDITAEMMGRADTLVCCGLAGAMVPAGLRPLVADAIRDGLIDVLVTTGATLTHDTIEAIGGAHHHGRAAPEDTHPAADDDPPTSTGDGDPPAADSLRAHDERLRTEGVDRIYDVYLPQEHFEALESHLRERVFPDLGRTTVPDLVRTLGEANAAAADGAEAEPGIAAAAAEADVPIYCPAIGDSVLGIQAWVYGRTADLSLDGLADLTDLTDRVADAERTGALVVGGGVPKNYVLQSTLAVPGEHDYAVQLTADPPETGGLSGATLDEARSWGKIDPDGRNASVYADATITLPILLAAVRGRLGSAD
jgi:deoxyhypusine synthase